MSQLTSTRALILLLAVTACDRAPDVIMGPAATPSALRSAAGEDPIGPGVLEAIERDGSAMIVVSLKDDDIPDVSPGRSREEHGKSLTARGHSVSAAQDEALADIPDEEVGVRRRFAAVPAFSAEAKSGAAVRKLAAKGRVRRIDLDVGGEGDLAVSVPRIGADLRYAAGNDGEGTVVAIIDTGIDTDHPDLADDVLQQACFGFRPAANGGPFCANGTTRQTGPGAAEDLSGHGTHVSGIVTSRGVQASRGVAPGAGIVALRVMDNCGFAGCFYAFSEIVAALDYIIQNNATLGVKVINLSLGTGQLFAGNCDNSTAFTQAGAFAVNTLRAMGVITFASAGNNNSIGMGAPACLSNVVSVGAANNLDVAASFTNGNATTDIFAPGVSIRSSLRNGGTTVASGTSMASPHAAGCAALLIQTGTTTPAAIEARLKSSAFTVTRNGITYPRIDCSPNLAPGAVLAGPYAGTEGSAITLNGIATDGDGDALTYSWSFGDGSPDESGPASTHATRSHTYVDNCTSGCVGGAYVVTLTVSDGRGGIVTRTTSAMIANAPPVVSVAGNQSILSGGTFTGLGGSFVDLGLADGPWSWTVSWGAGHGVTSGFASAPGAITATKQYLAVGTYTVTLDVTDKDGATDSRSFQLTVRHVAIGIDVKPGGEDETPISLGGSGGRIPVAVLSTTEFDAPALVDVSTVTLGDGGSPGVPVALRPNGTPMMGVEDVNGDGRPDLVLHFERNALMSNGLTPSTTTLRLLATLTDGRQVLGSEAVRIVGARPE
jgi:subtilisin family serine protease